MDKLLLLFFTLLGIVNVNVLALKCYICSANQDDIDRRCINNPETLPDSVRTCNKNYCTSVRIEYLDPKDEVQSITRGCEDKPQFINQVIEDTTFRSYYKACQTDLCNGGSGKGFSNIGGYDTDAGENLILLVPGIGHDSTVSIACNTFLIFVAVLSILLFYF